MCSLNHNSQRVLGFSLSGAQTRAEMEKGCFNVRHTFCAFFALKWSQYQTLLLFNVVLQSNEVLFKVRWKGWLRA